MKIEPVLSSQISLLKRRNLSYEKLTKENPMYAEKLGADEEIRDNCEKIASLIALIKGARELDAEVSSTGAEEEETEEAEDMNALPPLLGG